MSARFTAGEAEAWTGGRWSEPPRRDICGAVQDHRLLEPGMLYVALPGERVDGRRFMEPAYAAGAAGAVCAAGSAVEGIPCLEVGDPEEALRDVARGVRGRVDCPLIGVTGSAGKTTVKDLLASMWGQTRRVCATWGNWNNAIGLPLSLLRLDPEVEAGVFELGMNRPGEIADLAALLRPTGGLITSIGEAHLENLGSVEAIAREKGALLAALPASGLAVLEADGAWYRLFRELCRCEVVRCAFQGEAEVTGSVEGGDPGRLCVRDGLQGREFVLDLPFPGAHMRRNVLQAATMALAQGLGPEEIREGLAGFAPAPMRWEVSRIAGRRVVNDAYNANPLSMRAAIAAFAEGGGAPEEKWLVLGGMAELGEEEERLHREVGRFVDGYGWGGVIGVGPRAGWICAEIGQSPTWVAGDCREAAEWFVRESGDGSAVLLKGSRSERLEVMVSLMSRLLEVKAL